MSLETSLAEAGWPDPDRREAALLRLAARVNSETVSYNRVDRAHTLTKRELEVLTGYAHGLTRHGIAELYGISPETVKSETETARHKLAAKNKNHAVAIAFRAGLIR